MYSGRSEKDKNRLAAEITKAVTTVLHYGEGSVSVAIQDVAPQDWLEKVYKPDILGHPKQIYKQPGYDPDSL
jgi:4-oxalocrotonate tautomerase